MLLKLLREIVLRIGEIGAGKRDDLLIAQIFDADILHGRKLAVLADSQQIALVGDREEPQRADVLHRPNEAEIELARLNAADDVAGGAAGDVHADAGALPGDAGQKRRQDTDCSRVNRPIRISRDPLPSAERAISAESLMSPRILMQRS